MRNVNWEKQATSVFGGVNRRKRISDGEWGEAENLSTRDYPTATVREKRVIKELRARVSGTTGDGYKTQMLDGQGRDACATDGNVYVSYYAGGPYNTGGVLNARGETVETAGDPKQIVKFGRGVFTSDGTYVLDDDGEMTARKVAVEEDRQMNVEIADANGRSITARWLYKGENYDPDDPDSYAVDMTWAVTGEGHPVVDVPDGQIWFNTVLGGEYEYDITSGNWTFLGDSYVLLVGAKLHEGDFVHVEAGRPYINGDYTVVKAFRQQGVSDPAVNPMVKVTWDCALIKLTIPYGSGAQVDRVKITRRCPVFDHICTNRNRVWGCRYGLNDEGEFVNEIYASELGNPTNFFRVMDKVADESWISSVGTGGEWTGCVPVEDNVYFFKEDRIFVVTGTDPSNFGYREIEGPGVSLGMHKTIIVKDGSVYYGSVRGIYRISSYNYPVCIDEKLRQGLGMDAVGVADKDVLRWADAYRVVVYDTRTDAWMVEQGLGMEPFARVYSRNNPLLFCNNYSDGEEETVTTSTDVVLFHDLFIDVALPTLKPIAVPPQTIEFFWETVFEGPIGWSAETGLRGLADVELKRLRSLQIRIVTEGECAVRAWIEYDLDGTWVPIANEKRVKKGTFLIRHEVSRQCDFYRLKFEGVGDVTIYDIAEELEYGGEFAR